MFVQMFSVYQDPQGTKFQECTNSTINRSISTENEETYKRRIQGLNEEIKVLNHELEMVKICSVAGVHRVTISSIV